MNRIVQIAIRDFLAVVMTKGFIIGLLIMPAFLAVSIIVFPRFIDGGSFQVEGEYAVVDPTGAVFPEMDALLDPRTISEQRIEEFRQRLDQAPEFLRGVAGTALEQAMVEELGLAPNVRLLQRPADTDVEAEKAWLNEASDGLRHTALIVVHENAVEAAGSDPGFGSYDLFVAPNLDDRDLSFIHTTIRDAIINARVSRQSLDRDALESVLRVARPSSVTVRPDAEQDTMPGLNFMLPMAFVILLFMGLMTGSGTMLTSMIEEKSSRVVEILLSAVSPMELMAGKLLGSVAVSLVAMGLYLGIGLIALSSLSLFGLLDPRLIVYLMIFFLIAFFVVGSLFLAIGASVNELSEAQQLQMPVMLLVLSPMLLWPLVSRDPNSTLAVVLSFLPPVNPFFMLMRMASTQPPPLWQVWLSIAVGAASVAVAVWVAAKVFRIGLLMYGKPPNFRTLLRWVRQA